MEVANILDIDGTQWEMQDLTARNDIAIIKDFLTVKNLPNIEIKINIGYSASTNHIEYIQRYGKLYSGLLFIDNLSGKNIGTNEVADFGKINISLNRRIDAVGIEYLSSKPIRLSIGKNGTLNMQESAGVTSGNNRIRIPLIWFEA